VSRASSPEAVRLALLPIGALVLSLGLAALATMAVRDVAAGQGFLVERRLVVGIALGGLAGSLLAYGVSCTAAFRALKQLRELGATRPALWILGATGVATALPVLVAFLWPR
jgi:hypothetical protein